MMDSDHKFIITNKYIYNHSRWLEGTDMNGKIDSFQYHSFFDLTELAAIGDTFQKSANSLHFYILKRDSICHFIFDKKQGGKIVDCVSTRPK